MYRLCLEAFPFFFLFQNSSCSLGDATFRPIPPTIHLQSRFVARCPNPAARCPPDRHFVQRFPNGPLAGGGRLQLRRAPDRGFKLSRVSDCDIIGL